MEFLSLAKHNKFMQPLIEYPIAPGTQVDDLVKAGETLMQTRLT